MLLCLPLIFSACKSEDVEPVQEPEFSFKATVNDEEFESEPGTTIVLFDEYPDGHLYLLIQAYDIDNTDPIRTRIITLTIAGKLDEEIRSVLEYDPDNLMPSGVSGTYEELEDTETIHGGYSLDASNGMVARITSIDRENRRVSGFFGFIADDEWSDDVYVIEKGVFRDLVYTEL